MKIKLPPPICILLQFNKIHRLSIIFLISLLAACASETSGDSPELEEGNLTEVTFTLSSHYSSDNISRADDGIPKDPEYDNEKIKDWFLVFVDKDGKVRKILNRHDAETGITNSGAVEVETFKCILPSGSYSIYAFANISRAELSAAAGVSFATDMPMPESLLTSIWNGLNDTDGKHDASDEAVTHFGVLNVANATGVSNDNLNLWDIGYSEDGGNPGKPIPMTGYVNGIRVNNTIEESFSIEVVRMVAKIQFLFSNNSGSDITVNNVSLSPVTVTPVSLFQNYNVLGNSAFTALNNAEYARLTYTPSGGVSVPNGTSSTNPKSCSFYIKESLSAYANEGAFTVWLNVSHKDGGQNIEQYTLTQKIKDYINRNDWIAIPISLSRYDLSVEALFYPPIGGYPAVLSTTDTDGSQVFTFGTEGEFSIVPKIIDKLAGTHLAPTHYSIELGTVSDESGIFAKTPTVTQTSTSLPDEITGLLSTEKGKATVEVRVKIGTQTYTRKIYIIRN